MNLIKENIYYIEYRTPGDIIITDIKLIAESLEAAIEVFKKYREGKEIVKVALCDTAFRLPYKTVTVSI